MHKNSKTIKKSPPKTTKFHFFTISTLAGCEKTSLDTRVVKISSDFSKTLRDLCEILRVPKKTTRKSNCNMLSMRLTEISLNGVDHSNFDIELLNFTLASALNSPDRLWIDSICALSTQISIHNENFQLFRRKFFLAPCDLRNFFFVFLSRREIFQLNFFD